VIVAGDFNDTPSSAALKPLMSMQKIHDVLDLQFQSDMDKRWTYHYRKHEQIDYILISSALKEKFKSAGVERSGMYEIETLTKANEKRYSIIKEYKDSASDHAGVWAEFDV
jgi:endonuclease/exonuclease/phosphatase family metal-dependent hydrolase